MLFNSVEFLLFLPLAVAVNYILPKKVRYIWLLLCSYYFYMGWNPIYALLLLASTTITYCCSLLIDAENRSSRSDSKKAARKKLYLALCLALNLSTLIYFKYTNFFLDAIIKFFGSLGLILNVPKFDILLPVGISFFTFQALGYSIDVYRGDVQVERNFLRYALFVSFFPQLVAGPIERTNNLMPQLKNPQSFSYDSFKRGALLIIYGLFMKMVIADRAAIFVNTVFASYIDYPGAFIVLGTVLFCFQLYCDFYGYSTVARGAALMLGIKLVDNFNAPYFAKSTKEFWNRWHLSLSTWFRDYVYIPLGGNRKGRLRTYFNILFTFTLSGLWHGAAFNFVAWGFILGAYQIIADLRDKALYRLREKKLIPPKAPATETGTLLRMLVTFVLIAISLLIFRAPGLRAGLAMLKSAATTFNWWVLLDSIYTLGLDRNQFNVLFIAIALLLLVDFLKYKKKNVLDIFFRQGAWFKVLAVFTLILSIILFGCYGTLYDASEFIYFQF